MTYDLNESYYNEFVSLLDKYAIHLPSAKTAKLGTYFFLLSQEQQKLNLTSYRTLDEFVCYHLLDALQINQFIHNGSNQTLIDIGSGCGIPGVLLGILRSWSSAVMVESIKKKAEFIDKSVLEMGLNFIHASSDRAEYLGHLPEYRGQFDIVTARALAALPQALELCAPFIKQDGHLILPKGVNETIENPALIREELGISLKNMHQYSLPGRDKPFRLLIFQKEAPTKEKYPRKPGKIRKNPL